MRSPLPGSPRGRPATFGLFCLPTSRRACHPRGCTLGHLGCAFGPALASGTLVAPNIDGVLTDPGVPQSGQRFRVEIVGKLDETEVVADGNVTKITPGEAALVGDGPDDRAGDTMDTADRDPVSGEIGPGRRVRVRGAQAARPAPAFAARSRCGGSGAMRKPPSRVSSASAAAMSAIVTSLSRA